MTLLRISLAFTFFSTQDLRAPKWQNQDLDLGHELRTTLSPLYNGQTSSSSAVKETTVIYFFVYFAQNNRHLFYHTSRGQKPESRCKYSHPFSEDCRKEYFLSSQLLVVCLPSEDITVILMNTFIPWDHLCCHVGHHGKKKQTNAGSIQLSKQGCYEAHAQTQSIKAVGSMPPTCSFRAKERGTSSNHLYYHYNALCIFTSMSALL